MKSAIAVLCRPGSTFPLCCLVIAVLVPGSLGSGLSESRTEMDARYADAAPSELSAEAMRRRSIPRMLLAGMGGSLRVISVVAAVCSSVSELISQLAVSAGLLLRGIGLAWLVALVAALVSSAGRNPSLLWQTPATVLLAIPTAALATFCLLADSGGPVLVMALLLAARDFKFLDHALRKAWLEPHILQARAQGISTGRAVVAHMLPALAPQLGALASLSIVTALSALVPVEVIFNVPGVGQLAWNAALNRDLPVLLAVMILMAVAVTGSNLVIPDTPQWKNA